MKKMLAALLAAVLTLCFAAALAEDTSLADVKAKGAIDSLSGQPVTFKLPIPKSVTDRYAKIVHEYSGGSETFYLEIQKDEEGNQYVDVTVTHFSPFVVTFTNSKPSSGHSSSGGGSGGGSASLDNYDFWAKVQKSIERADGGDVIKANASKALNVPGSVLRALEGRDVTLVISYKGRELAIYGKNMPSIPDNKVYYTFTHLIHSLSPQVKYFKIFCKKVYFI